MSFWTAPVFSFFSKPFYVAVSQDRSKKGFLYLLYLAGISSVVMFLVMVFQVLPVLGQFAAWTKTNMPVLTVSKEGISMDRPSPYTMVHPEAGPLVTFQTDKDDIAEAEMGPEQILVTRSRIYAREMDAVRSYTIDELFKQNPQLAQAKEPLTITPQAVDRLMGFLKPILMLVSVIGTLIGFFIWKLLVAVVYSVAALGFNRMRSRTLSYGKVFDLTIYAMTPVVAFQWIRMLIPVIGQIPFLFVLDVSIALAYLYFAIKMSELPGIVAGPDRF